MEITCLGILTSKDNGERWQGNKFLKQLIVKASVQSEEYFSRNLFTHLYEHILIKN